MIRSVVWKDFSGNSVEPGTLIRNFGKLQVKEKIGTPGSTVVFEAGSKFLELFGGKGVD